MIRTKTNDSWQTTDICLGQALWKPPWCWLQAAETIELSTVITETFRVATQHLYLVSIHALIMALRVHLLWCGCELEHLVMHVVALWNVCVSWQQLQQAWPCVLWLVHYRMNYLWESKRQFKDIFSSQEIKIPSISDSFSLCKYESSMLRMNFLLMIIFRAAIILI